MTVLGILAAGGHHTAAGGSSAVLAFAVLLAGAGIAITYVADPPAAGATSAGATGGPSAGGVSRRQAAAAGAVAALIHVFAIRAHLGESAAHAGFFALLAVVQLGLAARLLGAPTPRVLRAGVAVSAWVLLLWLLTRSLGVAFVSSRQAVGPLDVTASALGVVLLLGCRTALRASPAPAVARAPGVRFPEP